MYAFTLLVVGFVIGFAVARATAGRGVETVSDTEPAPKSADAASELNFQQKQKENRKAQILAFLSTNQKVTNNDIEKLLGVSDATATRYLDELEAEGRIQSHGKGRSIYYSLKNE